jgi:hypothetical protein
MIRSITFALSLLMFAPIGSETVDVRHRGVVDLEPFACTDTPRSSIIQRVCYDKVQSYMLVDVRGAYYDYCELPVAVFDAFITAPSMGQFYNRQISGGGDKGLYDCASHRTPSY